MSKKKKAWAEDGFESWGGYMAAKKAKLEEQFLEDAKTEYQDTSLLFQGVAIFVNGYTDPTADELRRLMMEHGGIYHHYLRPQQTTHMIASNLPYSKIVMYMKSKNPLPLCKPSWITDSIKARKVLDFRKYLLYSQCTKAQPHLLNIFKSANTNNSSFNDSKSLKTTFLQKNELKSPIVSNKNGIVSKSPAVPSTSKTIVIPHNKSQNKFPTEEEFLNKSNLQASRSSISKVGPKDSLKTVSIKLNAPRLDPQKLESSITKSQVQENSELLNKSRSDKYITEVSKPIINNTANTTEASGKTEVKETNNSKSSYSSNCSKNSDFISDFYSNSRLHHIATMGATFKDYINELREKSSGKFPGLDRLIVETKFNRPGPSTKTDSDSEDDIFASDSSPNENLAENVIMHIDMDCFFVSVGIRSRPELKGLPVAVTHAKGNKPSTSADGNQEGSYSEIASCSYEARKFGLKNGMFLGQALKLCPNLKTIKYDFEGYKEVSYTLYDTVASYTLDIEAVSCDEMYADCSKVLSQTGLTPLEFADILRKEIKEKTGCPVSTGFGGNKLQARLATKKAKPDGKFYLKDESVLNYIGTLNAKDLPGVGYSTTSKLNAMNVKTCADLQIIGLSTLQKELGKKTGELLHNMCRGIDHSKLSLEHVRKSISAEVNYGIRFENHLDAEEFLKKLSVEICTRLKKANAKGRCITLKLMVRAKEAPKETAKFMGHGLCHYFTRSKNFIASVDELSIVTKEILILWNQMQQIPEDIRGIGIQMSRLEILKHKSNTGGLMNFINKTKQKNSEAKVEDSKNKPKQILDKIKENSSCSKSKEKERNSEITSFKTVPEKCNFQDVGNPVFLSEDKLILPSQDIDDSILNELPEDIRKEIEASKSLNSKSDKPKKGSSQGSAKTIQTKQESYFREKKPNIPKGKAKLPPIQEIDMAVLIELPEDIRNEILNEYKTNQNSDISSSTKPEESKSDKKEAKSDKSEIQFDKKMETKSNKESNSNINHLSDEREFSFSQVDPEFLAALPEDMRDDVQMYCMMKKRERNNAEKKKSIATKNNGISDNWSMFKQSKNLKSSKLKSTRGRKPKSVLGRNNGVATRVKEVERDKNKLEIIKEVVKKEEAKANEEKEKEEKEITEIISHMRFFPFNDIKSGGQEKALSTLVKCMFGLSVDQVRMQIQNWVSNSETVNEIDILSLATYLSMLPGKRLIEDLHVLLKCMHRCITKSRSCVWHETYRKIVEHVQHYMQIEYNSDLMVPSIGCNLHKCRGDDVF